MDDAFTDEKDSSGSEALSSDEYEIEDVLAHRWSGKHGCFKYFVKWRGCPPEENWWVLETQLNKAAKDSYNEKLKEDRAKKPMNKQVLLTATSNDITRFRTDPTKDFIVPDDVIITGAITSSSGSGTNIRARDEDNSTKPGASHKHTSVLERRKKPKKRDLQKKQPKEKSDGRLPTKNKKSSEAKPRGTRRVFLESDSSSSEEFFDSGRASVESSKKPRLDSTLAAYRPARKGIMSPPAQRKHKDSASVKKESMGAGTRENAAADAAPDHVVPSSTASFVGHPTAHSGKQVPSAHRDPASTGMKAALSEDEKVVQSRRRVREHIESVFWKKVTFEKMIHRDYYANITPNVAALEMKLFEVHQNTNGGYKRWCQNFFAVLFKAVLYGHLTPAELVALSAEQMQAPRFRVKFPPLSLGPDETCCKPIASLGFVSDFVKLLFHGSARRRNNED